MNTMPARQQFFDSLPRPETGNLKALFLALALGLSLAVTGLLAAGIGGPAASPPMIIGAAAAGPSPVAAIRYVYYITSTDQEASLLQAAIEYEETWLDRSSDIVTIVFSTGTFEQEMLLNESIQELIEALRVQGETPSSIHVVDLRQPDARPWRKP